MHQMILEQNFGVRNTFNRADKYERNLTIFMRYAWLRFIIAFDLHGKNIKKIILTSDARKNQLTFNTLTRTTPLLSTISWMMRPFFPITLPTKFRGT